MRIYLCPQRTIVLLTRRQVYSAFVVSTPHRTGFEHEARWDALLRACMSECMSSLVFDVLHDMMIHSAVRNAQSTNTCTHACTHTSLMVLNIFACRQERICCTLTLSASRCTGLEAPAAGGHAARCDAVLPHSTWKNVGVLRGASGYAL